MCGLKIKRLGLKIKNGYHGGYYGIGGCVCMVIFIEL